MQGTGPRRRYTTAMTRLDIGYNIAIEGDGYNLLVDWGDGTDWVKKLRTELDNAERISLIPKEGCHLPLVTVQLEENQRWVIFSRVFGKTAKEEPHQARTYCIGSQENIAGKNKKSLTWIYPNGSIEIAEEPSLIGLFI